MSPLQFFITSRSAFDALDGQFQSQILLLLTSHPFKLVLVELGVLLTQRVDLFDHLRVLLLISKYVLLLLHLVLSPLVDFKESLLLQRSRCRLGLLDVHELLRHLVEDVVKLLFDLGLYELLTLLSLLKFGPNLIDDLLIVRFLDALGTLIANLRSDRSGVHGVNVLLLAHFDDVVALADLVVQLLKVRLGLSALRYGHFVIVLLLLLPFGQVSHESLMLLHLIVHLGLPFCRFAILDLLTVGLDGLH